MYQHPKEQRDRVNRILSSAGHKTGGTTSHPDRAADIKMITDAVHEHERNMHPGKQETRLKLATGGMAGGDMAAPRMDKKSRGKGGPKHQTNIVIAPQGGPPRPVPVPVPAHPPMGGPPPGMGAMGGPPPGGPPMGAPPPRPMMPPPAGGGAAVPAPGMPPAGVMPPGGRPMIKTGGSLAMGRGGEGSPPMFGGAGSGRGRLDKAERQGDSPRDRY